MRHEDLLRQITPELYRTFRRSLELGRWPDGREMTPEQRAHCLRAVIAYDQMHKNESERVGFIERARKAAPAGSEQPLRWAAEQNDSGKEDE